MQAITTKFHGPTNYKGARVSARCESSRITIGWDHALNGDANHAAAAKALCVKMGWTGDMVAGWLPDNTGYAFVFTTSTPAIKGV